MKLSNHDSGEALQIGKWYYGFDIFPDWSKYKAKRFRIYCFKWNKLPAEGAATTRKDYTGIRFTFAVCFNFYFKIYK